MSRPVDIAALRPTQITLGMAFVTANRIAFAARKPKKLKALIRDSEVPVVLGPGGTMWMTDRHHFCRALLELGEEKVRVTTGVDASRLSPDEFDLFMEKSGLIHPFDDRGSRRPFAELPTALSELTDDPYRTLAGLVRKRGGYRKEKRPFAEFLWADFYRHRIAPDLLKGDLSEALEQAVDLADSKDAGHLPGWKR